MGDNKKTRFNIWRWLKQLLRLGFVGCIAYVVVVLIGLIPVNNSFVPAEEGVEVFLISNAVHADIIVPKTTDVVDWVARFEQAEFSGDVDDETHVAIGWGDRGFFLKTETWDDFDLSVAANALLVPSESCLHVSFTKPVYYSNAVSVKVSQSQYQSLVDHINGTFLLDDAGNYVQIPGYSYSTRDAFFRASGRYHLFNTCNSWVGRGLKSSGVRTPWFSPMPKTPMLYLGDE